MEVARQLLGFECAGRRYAVPLAWSQTVEEEFDLVDVPNAPAWIVGITSIEGVVSPVVDFSMLNFEERSEQTHGRRRLLVGGRGESGNNQSVALMFDGLPIHLESGVEESAHDHAADALREAIVGRYLADNQTGSFLILEPQKLYELLSARLEG